MESSDNLGDKVALALYMEGIIRFSKLKQGELSRGEKALPNFLPNNVKKKILSLFALSTGGRSRVVTPDLKDKAVCHIMVLALLINSLKLGNAFPQRLNTEFILCLPSRRQPSVGEHPGEAGPSEEAGQHGWRSPGH